MLPETRSGLVYWGVIFAVWLIAVIVLSTVA